MIIINIGLLAVTRGSAREYLTLDVYKRQIHSRASKKFNFRGLYMLLFLLSYRPCWTSICENTYLYYFIEIIPSAFLSYWMGCNFRQKAKIRSEMMDSCK